MKQTPRLFAALLVSVILAPVDGRATEPTEPIRIGVLYPTSGIGAVTGSSTLRGHDMAVAEINQAGGILGRSVVSYARDTKLKPATAASTPGFSPASAPAAREPTAPPPNPPVTSRKPPRWAPCGWARP